MMWECHVDEFAEIRYNIIICRYLKNSLLLNFRFFDHVIEGGDGPFEG